jgi:hypothetical protein
MLCHPLGCAASFIQPTRTPPSEPQGQRVCHNKDVQDFVLVGPGLPSGVASATPCVWQRVGARGGA